jgi:hypothetical protein
MQCRAKRYRIAANKKANIPLNQAAFHTAQRCKKYYGFLANPNISLQHNFNNTIIQADTIPLLQPFNLTFHNLCKVNDIPKGTKELLGLNLKYCISTNAMQQNINKTMLQLAYSIRTKCFLLQQGNLDDTNYEKQIYARNKHWNPPPASVLIEDKITEFEKALKEVQRNIIQKNKKCNLNNLTPLQLQALKALKNNKNFTIKPTDKNLALPSWTLNSISSKFLPSTCFL